MAESASDRNDVVTNLRARIAAAKRWGRPGVEELQAQLREVQLERTISDAVTAWPPLTDEQRTRLAALLAPSAGGETVAE